jgi:hypothetical protein
MKSIVIIRTELLNHVPARDTKFNSNPELFNKTYPFSLVSPSEETVYTSCTTLVKASFAAVEMRKYAAGKTKIENRNK